MTIPFGHATPAALALGGALLAAPAALGAPIAWVDWTAADAVSASGSANGVGVAFSGNLNPAAQTAGGVSFWASFPATYTSAPEVDNGPPDSDIIRLTGGPGVGTQTLTFSQPVTNPVMAILSLGQSSVPVTYDFDAAFEILNVGPGFFGNGTLTELPGDVLEGREGHGIIQFAGTLSSISWTIPSPEFWHGFTVGIADAGGPAPIPAPGAAWLLAMGGGLLFAVRRRRRA